MKLNKLNRFVSKDNLLLRNASWLLGAEVTARLSRIVTLIALAAALDSVEYGTAMLALAFHDIIRLILKCGSGAQIVQCPESQLAEYAGNGATIQWFLCCALAIAQWHIAPLIGDFYENEKIAYLVQWMAPTYLLYPLTSVNVFMVQRENKMRFLSIVNACCLIVENLGIAVMLMFDFGLEAIIFAKVANALLWTICFAFAPVQKFALAFSPQVLSLLISTSSKLFATEVFKSVRGHADLLIAGKILSPELFGVYSFAKSASMGISQSINNAYNSALYPYVCRLNRDNTLNQQLPILATLTAIVAIAFAIQGVLTPVYVPLLFGDAWLSSISAATILCLAASLNLLFDTYCNICRALGKFQLELWRRSAVSILSIAIIFLFSPTTPVAMAVAVLMGSAMWPVYFLVQQAITRIIKEDSRIAQRKTS